MGVMPLKDRDEYNAYMRDYMLRRYHARREMVFERLGRCCVRCGSAEELEADHIDSTTKSFPISRLWSVKLDRFLAEIEKCQILCRPCHVLKSREYGDYKSR